MTRHSVQHAVEPLPVPEWFDLRGTVAVVSGGGTHLGRAMATALAELGAAVHLVGRRAEVVERAAEDLRAAGADATAWACDSADEEGVAAMIDGVLDRHGRLDTAVCNAGGSEGSSRVPELRLEDLQATLRQNVGTTMVLAQAAARAMIPHRQGSIITVGSIHGSLGSNARRYGEGFRRSPTSYHASKGAVVNLTRALACDLGQYGITVNCISPGHVPTPRMDDVTRERLTAGVPLGRLGVPDDLRGAVALFASPAGRWITGQNLVVDGGFSAW